MNLGRIVMVQWNWLLIMLMVFFDGWGDVTGTAWDGITPWYTGSKCNCNGFSNRCFFDQKLYDATGHGGHCLDCSANRDGPNCERCRENYYMREDGYCIPCDCHLVGSRSLQCDANGKCQCHSGIVGEKCDRCAEGFYEFSSKGCKNCDCSEVGSINNRKNCDQSTGDCFCKENVEGKYCRECKPGFFHLDGENPFGCTPCFCYGHSSECSSTPGYSKYLIQSPFVRSSERWTAEDDYGSELEVKYESKSQSIGVKAHSDEAVYFLAPPIFLGDQRASYNQLLEFTLRIGDNRAAPTSADVILEGSGTAVSCTIFTQDNKVPNIQAQNYGFRLHEHPEYGWQPRLSSRAFLTIMSNLTAIKIRGTYSQEGIGFLANVKLHTAIRGRIGETAMWIESCECPSGYVGQFCESCAAGFRHFPISSGPYAPCIPCECNNHASICDSESGKCICQHNTSGENCQMCARGFYGNAFGGTPNDCRPCNCPDGGPCIQLDENVIMCTECPHGYSGHKCETCSDGFYGDPSGKFGVATPCAPCRCNENIDINAVGNCNTTTGECLKCIFNTAGSQCESCVSGYFGNALVLPKGDCKPCQCYPPGTITEDITRAPICDQTIGTCQCRPYVTGRNCDQCENGFYNIHSGFGCQACNCDPIGSLNQTCNVNNGQCYCRQGVTGLRCDHCEYQKYGFSYEGCKECECDPIGSSELQCDATGQCPCLENVEGRQCDRCKENKHDRRRGCIDCPECYTLVQEAAKNHNNKLEELKRNLDEIERRPIVINDEDFPNELKKVQLDISRLNKDVHSIIDSNGLLDQVHSLDETGKDVTRTLSKVEEELFQFEENLAAAERNIDNIEELSEEAEETLDEIKDTFEFEAKRAFDEASKRAKIAGEQSEKMTKLAHEARDLTRDIESRAHDTAEKAEDLKNKSIEAYTEVKEANFRQAQLVEDIRNFKEDLLLTEKKLNDTINYTKEISQKAIFAKNNATDLLTEINNILIPEVSTDELSERSKNIREESSKISRESEKLLNDTSKLREDLDKRNDDRKTLLDSMKKQQEDIEELKNDLTFALEQANAASKLWDEIYDSAVSNYDILKEFDTKTKKSKEEADAALKTVDEIGTKIKQIIEETSKAQSNVDEATKSANLALQKAEEAKDLAKDVSLETEQAKMEAELLFKNTTNLRNEAGLMYDRVQNTDGELKSLLEKHKSNESLVNEAREKVGRAGKDTDEVSRKIQNMLMEVEEIMSELENSPTMDERDIDRLEEQIRITEERLKDTKFEEKIEKIQKDHKARNEMIEEYKLEVAWLQNEIDNIEEVIAALPDGCFRRLELEP